MGDSPKDESVVSSRGDKEDDDTLLLGETELSLVQFDVGCEIGRGQFSQVLFLFKVLSGGNSSFLVRLTKGVLCHVSSTESKSSRGHQTCPTTRYGRFESQSRLRQRDSTS